MQRKPRQLSLRECYEILKIQKGADLDALKKAYRKRAFELHPDLNPGNPDAGRQFQLLNEAYVALSGVLKPADSSSPRGNNDGRAEHSASGAAAQDRDDREHPGTSGRQEDFARRKDGGGADAESGEKQQDGAVEDGGGQAKTASNAYAEQDVLRDLLNDPFARRVFEDIYSELNRQQADERKKSESDASGRPAAVSLDKQGKKSTKIHQSNLAWGTARWNMDFNKGIKGIVKDWMRRQIDEEQTLTLPAARLAPGKRIRLQIRQGLSNELRTVEITLPADFVVGKPVRLKGLGKRIGHWSGDLYLTLHTE
ncbi:MAG: DnaJ domain-containing protein [Desulfovibrio sp.]|jgi:molecular chaperone DnaJ|nr:DnaJ domain-containing protein [Desulfovibrio sp.]